MKIESNVPLPVKSLSGRKKGYTTAKRGQSKYDFKKMTVGKSFKVTEETRHSVSTLAKKFGDQQDPKWAFTVRADATGKLRCWRIE